MGNWDKKYNYLSKTRSLYLNDDYLQFLIEKIWKITKPINLIDVGCGYGYLGIKMLPMLPEGSLYTGIDISEELIDICNSVMMHLDNPDKAIQEMKRVTKNGGLVITCESNWNAVNALT